MKTRELTTINNLDNTQLKILRNDFFLHNDHIFNFYLKSSDVSKLNPTFIATLLKPSNEISLSQDSIEETTYRFSKDPIKIPKTINLLSSILIENCPEKDGIFRVNTIPEHVDALVSLLNFMLKDKIPLSIDRSVVLNTFDVFDISETYKVLLKRLNKPIIPNDFLRMAADIGSIELSDHRKICCKALLFALPMQNRMILESCIYLCKLIAEEGKESNYEKRMDLKGLAVVMTPNLIDSSIEEVTLEMVKKLVEFTSYLFENFESMITIT